MYYVNYIMSTSIEGAPKVLKQLRISEYRLGSGQTRPYITLKELELYDTKGKAWRTNAVRHVNVYR